ncbi:beta-glucoside-specific PTS transporter subunit IIABC [Arthrobacter sp. 35W]|uniref:beta-glucoside-specific PTS transporter subunit IIABC n=1 Tax=Arthrobacter sp. 35W TaxID=1132441 RepID=UPI00040170DA|nr:beta-glucoside-specific PTS transporter subunit IIABC [Arthrobacter sp. 35W]
MSKKYEPLAAQIIDLVGGAGNIDSFYHCQTRLRFELRDDSKADQVALNATDGVAKTLINGGQFQVVVGMHVKEVHDELERQLAAAGHTPADDGGVKKGETKKNIGTVIIDFVAGTFQPLIPALSGAGMVKALLALLVLLKVVSPTSQTFMVINFFADAVFYFMPILIAFCAANKLKSNPILAAGVAAIMMHPNWLAMVQAKNPVNFFDVIPLPLTSYAATVIPIILVILVQAHVERWLDKIIPAAVKLVFVPMLTFLVMGTLAMAVLGPIGSILGSYLGTFFGFLSTNAAWAPAVLIGAFLPLMVMFGLHNGVAPLGIVQMAQTGHDSIFGPGAICSNIAMGVATLVVAFRTKGVKMKQIATAGGITALMGITEPALYGVALPKRYPLVAAMIGGGSAGLYAGLTQTHRFATGSSGLPAVLLYIGDGTMQHFLNILISLAIGIVVTAVTAFALSMKYEKDTAAEDTASGEGSAPAAAATTASATGADLPAGRRATATLERTDVIEFTAPCTGTLIPLANVADPVFSSKTMGPGVGIEPANGRIVSPCSGTVTVAMDTGHAFGIRSDDGVDVLVHVGIDTVAMNGEGFTAAVARGTRVEAGDLLVMADLEAITAAGHPTTVILVVTNHAKVGDVTAANAGPLSQGERVLTVTR